MKKKLLIIVVVCFALTLSACTGREPNNPITTGDPHALLPTESDEQPTEESSEAPTEAPTPEPTEAPVTCSFLNGINGAEANFTSIEPAKELKYWNGKTFRTDDAEGTVTVEFEGRKYKGYYYNSLFGSLNSYLSHRYLTEDNIQFSINGDTGELVSMTLSTEEFFSKERDYEELEEPRMETESIALSYLSMLVDEPECYEMTGEPYVRECSDDRGYQCTLYQYEFIRKINGFDSTAKVFINITSKGHLAYFGNKDTAAFSEMESHANRFNEADVCEMVREILIQSVPEDYEIINDDLQVEVMSYALTPDGEVVIVVLASISVRIPGWIGDADFGGIFVLR